MLMLIAIFNKKAFIISLLGFAVILIYKIFSDGDFNIIEHFFGKHDIIEQIINKHSREGEWHILLNLFGLLLGFELLSKIFQHTAIPELLPKYLPDDWKGPFVLLLFVFILSAFLDNIAGALIGGAIAAIVFNGKVNIGFLVAIVAASNAGGSGSVIGDTTTTMMWLNGVSPLNVLHAYIAAVVAFLFFGIIASFQQHKYQPIQKDVVNITKPDYGNLLIVILILAGAILTNIFIELPFIGVWLALIIGAMFRKIPWKEAGKAFKGTMFLLFLVFCCFAYACQIITRPFSTISFFFRNKYQHFSIIYLLQSYAWSREVTTGACLLMPLVLVVLCCGLALLQVFAITNEFPEARNAGLWLRKGWYIIPSYIIGFLALYFFLGWNPIK